MGVKSWEGDLDVREGDGEVGVGWCVLMMFSVYKGDQVGPQAVSMSVDESTVQYRDMTECVLYSISYKDMLYRNYNSWVV